MQRRGTSAKRLRDEFIADERLSLFALKSFWEGFDAQGRHAALRRRPQAALRPAHRSALPRARVPRGPSGVAPLHAARGGHRAEAGRGPAHPVDDGHRLPRHRGRTRHDEAATAASSSRRCRWPTSRRFPLEAIASGRSQSPLLALGALTPPAAGRARPPTAERTSAGSTTSA